MEKVDLIVNNAIILTMDAQEQLIEQGAMAIKDGQIMALGSVEDLQDKYAAVQTHDAGGKLLLPGFINTHAHLFQTFSRGLGKDMPFVEWLANSVRLIMPYMDEEAYYLAAMIGCMEAMQTGITTMLDYMYANVKPEFAIAVIRAFEDVGIRGIMGRGLCDREILPWGSRSTTYEPMDVCLGEIHRLQIKYQNHPRIKIAMAPTAIWGMTREGLAATAEFSRENDLLVTMHLQENSMDDDYALKEYGIRSLPLMEEVGMLNARFNIVHGIVLEAEDYQLLEQYKVSLSHNPHSNMILGSGVAPVPELLKRGIKIGLGVDGAASNDDQNMLSLMKSAALLQKVHHLDAGVMGAREVLSMATRQGAESIGFEDSIGSLEVGKKADFVLVDQMAPNMVPCYDHSTSLVYNSHPGNIDSVVINGKFVIEKGNFTSIDVEEIICHANQKASELRKLAEIVS
jgi:5-methylthioadenosine/S-adenosylhomocysteine deaminase